MWQEISVGSNFAIFAISSAIRKNKFLQIEIFLVVSPAWLVCGKLRIPGKAWTISMVLFIVNCGLKVGNSFLYIFSRFQSFTEILDTFGFLCL